MPPTPPRMEVCKGHSDPLGESNTQETKELCRKLALIPKNGPGFKETLNMTYDTSPKAPYGLLVCHTVQKGSCTHLCLLKLYCLTAFQVTSSEQFSIKMGAF